MPKINREELKRISIQTNTYLNGFKSRLMVCTGTGCAAVKGFRIKDKLIEALEKRGLSTEFLVVGTGCHGFCAVGPILVVQPEGIFYEKIRERDIDEIIESHLIGGKVVERLCHKESTSNTPIQKTDQIEFFKKQRLIALRHKGAIDPENIDHYIARGGYESLANALRTKPDRVIQEVIASGIRGRGGAGFPTGVKWESCRAIALKKNEVAYTVCNADEGDPGAFMDRCVIESDPHSVIEGMIIGGYAVGSTQGYVYIRNEYPLALSRLNVAIEQAREYGVLGERVLDSDFSFDINIHRGAGAFVCGESTALMASMSGKVGEPRAKYLHNVEFGYRDKPTILNNVETWATIPVIIEKGAEWFSSIGTGDVTTSPWGGSAGTKIFSLVGDVKNTGLVEVPLGITLREIVFDIGGGIPNGKRFKAVQTGGPSGGCLPEELLDIKVDFDSLAEVGSMMGSGGLIVMSENTCMVDVARYFIEFLMDESCGKCTPCREGLYILSSILRRICQGEGRSGDIELLEEVSDTICHTSLCQLGASAPNPVKSTIRYFREEYETHINERRCLAGVCNPLINYHINENCSGCLLCKKQCPTAAISGEKGTRHLIDTEKCVKCGICYEVCTFDSVEIR